MGSKGWQATKGSEWYHIVWAYFGVYCLGTHCPTAGCTQNMSHVVLVAWLFVYGNSQTAAPRLEWHAIEAKKTTSAMQSLFLTRPPSYSLKGGPYPISIFFVPKGRGEQETGRRWPARVCKPLVGAPAPQHPPGICVALGCTGAGNSTPRADAPTLCDGEAQTGAPARPHLWAAACSAGNGTSTAKAKGHIPLVEGARSSLAGPQHVTGILADVQMWGRLCCVSGHC